MAMLFIGGCHKAQAPDAAKPAAAKAAPSENAADAKAAAEKETAGVSLSAEQIEKIGLKTAAAKATSYADEITGYGTVIPHEGIAQAAADLATAEAAEKQSRSALARAQRLAGTAGAVSSDVEETNVRQAAVDTAALTLAKQRLSATLGQKAPWAGGGNQNTLSELAGGATHLVRVTFPLGSLSGDGPQTLRASRIGSANGKRWAMTPVWSAPADASVPGRSFFAVLRNSDLGEGERVIGWAPVGAARSGILIPADAVVVSEGKYWVYLEDRPGHFVRTEISADKAVDDGYFVTGPVKAGDKIVTDGVAQLLAQESNSRADAE
ncbi:MAG TPA: hypothetical protein VHS76_14945 [Steroidobacteraceae bacterium]|nr:hypothetical protein [Steroidobacteraceae bacterium]